MEASGLDYSAWEEVIRAGLANGALTFDDAEHELMREFYVGDGSDSTPHEADNDGIGQAPVAGMAGIDQPPASPRVPVGVPGPVAGGAGAASETTEQPLARPQVPFAGRTAGGVLVEGITRPLLPS